MRLEVRYHDASVGILNDDTGSMLFQYDEGVIRSGLELSPTPELTEQSLSVNGKWADIDRDDLMEVGDLFSIIQAGEIVDQVNAL